MRLNLEALESRDNPSGPNLDGVDQYGNPISPPPPSPPPGPVAPPPPVTPPPPPVW